MPGLLSPSASSMKMPVYATSAERNAAISYPYVGQQTYISSTSKIEFWSGSAWIISNQDAIQPQLPVTVYANAAARDAAIPSPTEGRMVYLQSNKTVYIYNAVSWVPVGAIDINPLSVAGM